MKHLAIIALVLLPLACAHRAGTTKSTSTPGRGAIKLTITPNPVVAMNVGGNTYEFPFDAVVKETGGHPVTIERVTANVFAAGGIPVATESYDAAKIQSLGFASAVQAKGEIHYRFAPRKEVPDASLFTSVYGDIRVEGIDDNGSRTTTTTTITLKKG
ncbi:MAG: hypothetical protein JO093_08375 [Acidobacteria bacterium]|nr:hypothetical protein [Acidobacteriota bacterium]MBV9185624.1 hypothetical protein [Acidobacteriota bacterium]